MPHQPDVIGVSLSLFLSGSARLSKYYQNPTWIGLYFFAALRHNTQYLRQHFTPNKHRTFSTAYFFILHSDKEHTYQVSCRTPCYTHRNTRVAKFKWKYLPIVVLRTTPAKLKGGWALGVCQQQKWLRRRINNVTRCRRRHRQRRRNRQWHWHVQPRAGCDGDREEISVFFCDHTFEIESSNLKWIIFSRWRIRFLVAYATNRLECVGGCAVALHRTRISRIQWMFHWILMSAFMRNIRRLRPNMSLVSQPHANIWTAENDESGRQRRRASSSTNDIPFFSRFCLWFAASQWHRVCVCGSTGRPNGFKAKRRKGSTSI